MFDKENEAKYIMMADTMLRQMNYKMIRSVNPTEHQIQSSIVEWAYTQRLRDTGVLVAQDDCYIGDLLIAIPNGGRRDITEAKKLKKDGVKAGVSDLFLAYISYRRDIKGKVFAYSHGLWIEVKTKKGRVSRSQEKWLHRMSKIGYGVSVVRSVDEGIQAIKHYVGMK